MQFHANDRLVSTNLGGVPPSLKNPRSSLPDDIGKYIYPKVVIKSYLLPDNEYPTVADPGFSQGGANSQSGCANLFFSAKNCMKMKELRPPGGHASLAPPLDPPLSQATFPLLNFIIISLNSTKIIYRQLNSQ